jgi:putative ABC transport system permease protein
MFMYAINEFSYDKFNENSENIYRIGCQWGNNAGAMKFAGSMPAITPALKENFPGIVTAARIQKEYNTAIISIGSTEFEENDLFYAEQSIFDIFSFSLLDQSKNEVLSQPYSVVLSEETAIKYFGSGNAVGKTIQYRSMPFNVTGVMKNIPRNSHLRVNIFVSYNTLEAMQGKVGSPWNQWGNDYNYVLLGNETTPEELETVLYKLLKDNTSERFSNDMKFIIQNLSDIHWQSDLRGDFGPKENKDFTLVSLGIAILIMIIAGFNFINLSTARYFERIKEIGVRKIVGAGRLQIAGQFLTESLLLILVSAFTGVTVFELVYPYWYSFIGTELITGPGNIETFSSVVLIIVIIAGLLAVTNPAFFIAGFKPANALQNRLMSGNSNHSIRKTLLMSQFMISVILVFGAVVAYKQLNFMRTAELGYDKENVLILRLISNDSKEKYDVLKKELLSHSGITAVSGAYTVPGVNSQETKGITIAGAPQDESFKIRCISVDYGYLETIGAEIKSGRNFSEEHSTDADAAVIINETALKMLNISDPLEKKLSVPMKGGRSDMSIVGVVKDYHVQSLRDEIPPLMLYINPDYYFLMMVKLETVNASVISFIESVWDSILPNEDFTYKYLDDSYQSLYSSEEKLGSLLVFFTMLAITVSCLGLFGLASMIISRKVKEIGVRKVLGATTAGIVASLSKEFILWVLAANILALPAGYYLMNQWLQSYAYKINMNAGLIIIPVIVSVLIAGITVGARSLKASMANPVDSLRDE